MCLLPLQLLKKWEIGNTKKEREREKRHLRGILIASVGLGGSKSA